MIRWFRHRLKKFGIKFYLFLQGRTTPKVGSNDEQEYQKVCLSICRKLIKNPESSFLIAPISGKKYIKNEKMGIFIVMIDQHINITNHTYNYSVFISPRDWQRISYFFDHETESRKNEYEEQIKSQITHSLDRMLEGLKKNQ
jgi:hypothetical protein